ncbi:hypothetical protein ACHQM5_004225 [Ranunculus cassubicifolius]
MTMEEDLIEEILVCLPVKTLARFKCISKEWNHFISFNKRFRRRYLDKCTDPELGRFLMLGLFVIKYQFPNVIRFVPTSTHGTTSMLKNKKRKRNDGEEEDSIIGGFPLIPIDESLDFTTTHHPPYIVGCSNGFLLCTDVHYHHDYMICNPITNHCIYLPPINFRDVSMLTHGFICHGTSPCLDTVQSYTVMRATWPHQIDFYGSLNIEIVSSDDPEEWKIFNLQTQFSFCIHIGAYTAISENGVIYITAVLPNGRCFLVFDRKTSTESLQLLEFPEATKGGIYFSAMSDGLLACTHWQDDRITIWMLDHRDGLDFTRQWSVKHSAMLPRKMGDRVIGCHPLDPLVLFISCYKKTLLYDAKSSRQEVLCSEYFGTTPLNVVPYTYGLVGRRLFLDG